MSEKLIPHIVLMAEVKNRANCNKVRDMDRERVWKVMRVLREFTADEISVLTGISLQLIRGYIFILGRAEYVRQAGLRKDETGQRKVVFNLVRNTGPKAPQQICCLLDENVSVSTPPAKKKVGRPCAKAGGQHVD